MKLFLAVLVSVCAGVLCENYKDCCTIEDRREVQRVWNDIWAAKSSSRRVTLASETFKYIVSKHKDVGEFFKLKGITGSDDPDAKALGQRLFTDLDIAINLLDDPAALKHYLRLVAIRHENVAGNKTPVFLDYFIEGLNDIVGKVGGCHNTDAFKRCFATLGAMADAVQPKPVPATLPANPLPDTSAPAAPSS